MSKRETETEKAERVLVDDDSVFDAIRADHSEPPTAGDLMTWTEGNLHRFSDETLDVESVEWDDLTAFFGWE